MKLKLKLKSKLATLAAAIVTAMTMGGCATSQDAEHGQHHQDTSTAQTAGMMSSGRPGDQMAIMDMNDMAAMCDRHKKMMSAQTPEEHKAMMDEHMRSMPPEMMKKHMAMMEKCK
jgi:hypothetical protein